jgi:endonuclease YncB( thermonuclease family)
MFRMNPLRPVSDPAANTLTAVLVLTLTGMLCVAWGIFARPANAWQPPALTPKTETAAAVQPCPPRGITIDAVVTRVLDGDTIAVRSSVEFQVRLIDCWAPESRTRDQAEKSRGLQSKARMQQLADGKSVRVHIPGSNDLTNLTTLGRVLARVWVITDAEPESHDLSTRMVSENLATSRKQAPVK